MPGSLNKSPHILVVDDDREIRQLVGRALEREGFRTTLAADGAELMRAMERQAIDLVVLDIMLPGKDGLALCRDLRARKIATPVILLTTKGEDIVRIIDLEMGADDYLAKPFNSRELVARIRAVLRRTQTPLTKSAGAAPRTASFDGWRFDLVRRELVSRDGLIISLSTGEFDLLSVFVMHAQKVLSREELRPAKAGDAKRYRRRKGALRRRYASSCNDSQESRETENRAARLVHAPPQVRASVRGGSDETRGGGGAEGEFRLGEHAAEPLATNLA